MCVCVCGGGGGGGCQHIYHSDIVSKIVLSRYCRVSSLAFHVFNRSRPSVTLHILYCRYSIQVNYMPWFLYGWASVSRRHLKFFNLIVILVKYFRMSEMNRIPHKDLGDYSQRIQWREFTASFFDLMDMTRQIPCNCKRIIAGLRGISSRNNNSSSWIFGICQSNKWYGCETKRNNVLCL